MGVDHRFLHILGLLLASNCNFENRILRLIVGKQPRPVFRHEEKSRVSQMGQDIKIIIWLKSYFLGSDVEH